MLSDIWRSGLSSLREFTDIVSFAGHMVEPGGKLMAMKGQLSDEVEQVDGPFTVNDVIPLQVPGLNAQRHLVVLVHSDET